MEKESQGTHWKKMLLKKTPPRDDLEEFWDNNEEISLVELREQYVMFRINFRDNVRLINKDNPEEVNFIEDWEYEEFCTDKIKDIDEQLEQQQIASNFNKKYIGMSVALAEYVIGVSDDDLCCIITNKKLALGSDKKKWIGSKADAHRFISRIYMSVSKFNKCFFFEDNKPLHAKHKVGGTYKEGDGKCQITKILEKYNL